MTVILFIIVLAVLIFVHELGHFLVAKKSGIRVDEFAIGFPPKLFSLTWGETKYILNLIPFGGYVKIFGENPDDPENICQEISERDKADVNRKFTKASRGKQIAVLLAGIFFNIVFAWGLISISYMFGSLVPIGSSNTAKYSENIKDQRVIITGVANDSVAEKIGLRAGDSLIKIISNGQQYGDDNPSIITVEQIQEAISGSQGDMTIYYLRNNEFLIATGTPVSISSDSTSPNRKIIGVYMERVGVVQLGFFAAIWEGAKVTVSSIKEIIVGLSRFIFQTFIGRGDFSQVSGPIGIAGLVGDAVNFGLAYFFSFFAFISLNLAVINLIPFPALDGGRVFFVLIEMIIRKPIKPKIVNILNTVGFFVLIALMLFITYKDILRLF